MLADKMKGKRFVSVILFSVMRKLKMCLRHILGENIEKYEVQNFTTEFNILGNIVSNPLKSLDRPWGIQQVYAPRFQDNRHMRMVRLSALRTGRLIPGTHFYLRLRQPRGHSTAGRIISMKNCNYTSGDRTHDLPACSAVLQPTAPF